MTSVPKFSINDSESGNEDKDMSSVDKDISNEEPENVDDVKKNNDNKVEPSYVVESPLENSLTTSEDENPEDIILSMSNNIENKKGILDEKLKGINKSVRGVFAKKIGKVYDEIIGALDDASESLNNSFSSSQSLWDNIKKYGDTLDTLITKMKSMEIPLKRS